MQWCLRMYANIQDHVVRALILVCAHRCLMASCSHAAPSRAGGGGPTFLAPRTEVDKPFRGTKPATST